MNNTIHISTIIYTWVYNDIHVSSHKMSHGPSILPNSHGCLLTPVSLALQVQQVLQVHLSHILAKKVGIQVLGVYKMHSQGLSDSALLGKSEQHIL